jgi:16S rRNA (cytosine1402-N4)-methyltransferase
MRSSPHVPVMQDETLEHLQPGPGKRIVDGTYGYGGHAAACLAAGAAVLGLDLDPDAVAACRETAATTPALHCRQGSFRDLASHCAATGWAAIDGLLLDLGVNSRQLDDPDKGFSYRGDGPLDLRFDRRRGEPASRLVTGRSEKELEDVLREFGEERGARRIARAIVAARATGPIDTTGRLRAIVVSALPRGVRPEAALSRCFQALRIAVNDELGALRGALASGTAQLAAGGRLVVLAYHSLEDRIVKQWLDRESRDCICPPELPACRCGHAASLKVLTRRAVKASAREVAANPRSRSVRLRAAEALGKKGARR